VQSHNQTNAFIILLRKQPLNAKGTATATAKYSTTEGKTTLQVCKHYKARRLYRPPNYISPLLQNDPTHIYNRAATFSNNAKRV